MKPFLLDINVLVALAWPNHAFHHAAQQWFEHNHSAGFRTCPITQSGFVRVSSSATHAASPREARVVLGEIVTSPNHEFWPDDLTFAEAVPYDRILIGHRQVTDAYLMGLAEKRRARFATFDRAVLSVAPTGLVELIL